MRSSVFCDVHMACVIVLRVKGAGCGFKFDVCWCFHLFAFEDKRLRLFELRGCSLMSTCFAIVLG